MKNIVIKISVVVFVVFGIFSNVYSNEWIEKVVVDSKFEVSSKSILIIDHEYGNVVCKNWDKNEISVKVTVRVKTDDKNIADRLINNVMIDVDGNSKKVEATCSLNSKNRKSKNTQVAIDFEIYMPKTVSIELKQQFGNLFIESVLGVTNINSEYSSVEILLLDNIENKLDFDFCDVDITSINNADVNMSYSNLLLGNVDNLSVKAEYSDVTINNAADLKLAMEGGSVKIQKIGRLQLNSEFSDIEIGLLDNLIVAEVEYGNLIVKDVDVGFSLIKIDNEYGRIFVNVDKEYSYTLNIQSSGNVVYPEKISNISHKNVSSTNTTLSGVVGNNNNSNSAINIVSEYGSVNISAN